MNDFTKEELKELLKWKYEDCYKNPCDQKIIDPLINKIQSIIDNYCEHENTKFIMDVGIDKCTKCGEFLNE